METYSNWVTDQDPRSIRQTPKSLRQKSARISKCLMVVTPRNEIIESYLLFLLSKKQNKTKTLLTTFNTPENRWQPFQNEIKLCHSWGDIGTILFFSLFKVRVSCSTVFKWPSTWDGLSPRMIGHGQNWFYAMLEEIKPRTCFIHWNRVSLCNPGRPATQFVDQIFLKS